MSHVIDKNYFPGWVRKAVTFTIDDGNIEMDKKFIDIVRPAGILGAFNLCGASSMSPEEYRTMYKGYEISNHVMLHPHVFDPGVKYPLTNEVFDISSVDMSKFYRHPKVDGVYLSHGSFYNPKRYTDKTKGWFHITDSDTYVKLIDMAHKELEEVFGKGSVRGFVWPFSRQLDCKKILDRVKSMGYYGARDAGSPVTDFNMPKDRMSWKYCSTDGGLLSVMKKYEELPDDGELKFFSFGVHSIDFENNNTWNNLVEFCEKYSRRPDDYFYSTVGNIFDYEDAINSLLVTETELKNDSDLPLYVKIDGDRITVAPKSTYKL